MNKISCDLLVIGGGASGIGAALKAAKEGVDVIVVERLNLAGGILNQCIHNGFGLHYFKKELTGPEYAANLLSLTKDLPIKFLFEHFLLSIDKKSKTAYFTSEKGINAISCKALVYSAGARERPFGSLLIPGDRVSGIYTAGVAQKFINIENRVIGKRAMVLGSGDIGLIMARRLTLEGIEVVAVCERMPYPGGLSRNINQCLKDFGIPLLLSTTVTEVRGDGRLSEVITSELDENYNVIEGSQRSWSVDTLVLSVGLVPSTTLMMDYVDIDSRTRGIIVDSTMNTSAPWIFSSGNCVIIYDLVDYVTKEGEIAGRYATQFIKEGKTKKKIPIKKGIGVGITNCAYWVEETDLPLYLRANKPIEKGRLVVRAGNSILYEGKEQAFIPSEMVHKSIKSEQISKIGNIENITVEII
ncbi:MAG: NAD(P)/FAD-dependent oxidoreductase [Exilispira sp.]|jgi:NADPH-dependent 2,4-dienoyl-CoA reductase/sulfur reductase-like enzyme|nr:NAD(P)/FAD-dependent oxidoreductase [Exilispira sp.]